MTSTTHASRTPRTSHPAVTRPSLVRLTEVELRKSVDTRAARVLLAIIALGSVAVGAAQVLDPSPQGASYAPWLGAHQVWLSFLLPVVAILTVTGEWGARTAPGTFALVPCRQRVLGAKLAAVVALTLVGVGGTAVITAVATGLGAAVHDVPADFSITGWQVLQPVVSLLLGTLFGFALGLLLLNAAAAIVVLFATGIVTVILSVVSERLASAAPWIDQATALGALGSAAAATPVQWAQVATTSAIWVLLPAALGALRVQRAEI